MFLKVGTTFYPADTFRLRVVDRKITGYQILISTTTATVTFTPVAPGDDVDAGTFTNGGIFNKIITS